MTENRSARRWAPGPGCISGAVVLAVAVVFLAVILPAINNARNSARQIHSKNNLRQIGLALHNYHDANLQFPVGGDIRPDGRAKHGWYVRSLPYLDANPLYSMIDFDVDWESVPNRALFQRTYSSCDLHPASDQRFSSEDFGLLHYMANPNVMHRNSSVALSDMLAGSQHNWLVGEICGDYQPWSYPFNWRPLELPFNSGRGYGNPIGDHVQIGLADGSVAKFSNGVDPAIVKQLAAAQPVASSADTARPGRTFQTMTQRSGAHAIPMVRKDGTPYLAK